MPVSRPYPGVFVLDLGTDVADAHVTMLLAELGVETVRFDMGVSFVGPERSVPGRLCEVAQPLDPHA